MFEIIGIITHKK